MHLQYGKQDHSGDMMCVCVCIYIKRLSSDNNAWTTETRYIKLSSGMVCNCKCLYKFVEIEFMFWEVVAQQQVWIFWSYRLYIFVNLWTRD